MMLRLLFSLFFLSFLPSLFANELNLGFANAQIDRSGKEVKSFDLDDGLEPFINKEKVSFRVLSGEIKSATDDAPFIVLDSSFWGNLPALQTRLDLEVNEGVEFTPYSLELKLNAVDNSYKYLSSRATAFINIAITMNGQEVWSEKSRPFVIRKGAPETTFSLVLPDLTWTKSDRVEVVISFDDTPNSKVPFLVCIHQMTVYGNVNKKSTLASSYAVTSFEEPKKENAVPSAAVAKKEVSSQKDPVGDVKIVSENIVVQETEEDVPAQESSSESPSIFIFVVIGIGVVLGALFLLLLLKKKKNSPKKLKKPKFHG